MPRRGIISKIVLLFYGNAYLNIGIVRKTHVSTKPSAPFGLALKGFLLKHLPQVERIATPSWEPTYDLDREAWPRFLETVGYGRIGEMAFGKDVLPQG